MITHNIWAHMIHDMTLWQLAISPSKNFAPIWRMLQLKGCPLSRSKALSLHNNAFLRLFEALQKGRYNEQKANNQ